MVFRVLIALLLVFFLPAWGKQSHQYCVSCHQIHYVERGSCTDCHKGNPESERKNIAHERIRAGKYVRFTLGNAVLLKTGQRLMDQLACRRCHVSEGRGNSLTTNLDGIASRRAPSEMVQSIRKPVANMPDFALTEEHITLLINIIFSGSHIQNVDKAGPVKVHFNVSKNKAPDFFSTKCGSCHRVISPRLGALGVGNVGPNISGLFSKFYPKTFRGDGTWTGRNFETWLKNPRMIRTWSRMPPVILTGDETQAIISIVGTFPEDMVFKELSR